MFDNEVNFRDVKSYFIKKQQNKPQIIIDIIDIVITF